MTWDFSLETQEKLEDIKWYYYLPNGTREDIANYVNVHFAVVADSFMNRLSHLSGAGIQLKFAKVADSGRYLANVLVLENSTTYLQYSRSLILEVTNGKRGLPLCCLNCSTRSPYSLFVSVCENYDL